MSREPSEQEREVELNHEHDILDEGDDERHRRRDLAPSEPRTPSRDGQAQSGAVGDNAPPLPFDASGALDLHILQQEIVQARTWAAPMPEPDVLRDYDEVLPGAAERILRAFESVTVDASARDDRIVDADNWVAKTGAGWAFALLLFCFFAAVAFFVAGNNYAGSAFLGAPIVMTLLGKIAPPRRDGGHKP